MGGLVHVCYVSKYIIKVFFFLLACFFYKKAAKNLVVWGKNRCICCAAYSCMKNKLICIFFSSIIHLNGFHSYSPIINANDIYNKIFI